MLCVLSTLGLSATIYQPWPHLENRPVADTCHDLHTTAAAATPPPAQQQYTLKGYLDLDTESTLSRTGHTPTLGFLAAFDYHKQREEKETFSVLILLCGESATAGCRATLVSLHSPMGIFLLAIATCAAELTEKARFKLSVSYQLGNDPLSTPGAPAPIYPSGRTYFTSHLAANAEEAVVVKLSSCQVRISATSREYWSGSSQHIKTRKQNQ